MEIIIIGGGFGGINCAKQLAKNKNINIKMIDKCNHHLFQPLLYQVATSGLTAEDIAYPIRSILSEYKNVNVIYDYVTGIDSNNNLVLTNEQSHPFDYLILACGSTNYYFGKNEWEEFAPGMKSIDDAIQIRKKILTAFECAEIEKDPQKIKELLTFMIIGGGPTGVELAGSLVEMCKHTMSKDFRNINPTNAKVFLIEAGPALLPSFTGKQSNYAKESLEKLGVTVKLNSKVQDITSDGIQIDQEFYASKQVIWAAGVGASAINKTLNCELDSKGRVIVEKTLHIPNKNNIYVIGDQANCLGNDNKPLPGLAPVAMQQGKHAALNILNSINGKKLETFHYFDKGQMATIRRGYDVVEFGQIKSKGFFAWLIWLFIHIIYLITFRNKLIVFIRWVWMYISYSRGARLINSSAKPKN